MIADTPSPGRAALVARYPTVVPHVLDVDADLAWALGLMLIAVLAIALG